jgi:hypothetical protein
VRRCTPSRCQALCVSNSILSHSLCCRHCLPDLGGAVAFGRGPLAGKHYEPPQLALDFCCR